MKDKIFTVTTIPQICPDTIVGITYPSDFSVCGGLGESPEEFNEFCSASREIDDGDLTKEQFEAIVVLLNRAVAYGRRTATK